MNSAVRVLLELLFPPRCVFCRNLLEKSMEERICPSCRQKLPECHEIRNFPHISRCFAAVYYEDLVRDAILRYKFQGAAQYSMTFGHLLSHVIREQLSGKYDLITWVPVSRKRLRARGYDQAQLLAQRVAADCGTKAEPLLTKIQNNPQQSSLHNASARRKNVQGVYEPLHAGQIAGKRILLIDDVVTTGATMSECAGVLLEAGALQVTGAALAARRLNGGEGNNENTLR